MKTVFRGVKHYDSIRDFTVLENLEIFEKYQKDSIIYKTIKKSIKLPSYSKILRVIQILIKIYFF